MNNKQFNHYISKCRVRAAKPNDRTVAVAIFDQDGRIELTESSCTDPSNFDWEAGIEAALRKGIKELWRLKCPSEEFMNSEVHDVGVIGHGDIRETAKRMAAFISEEKT